MLNVLARAFIAARTCTLREVEALTRLPKYRGLSSWREPLLGGASPFEVVRALSTYGSSRGIFSWFRRRRRYA